MATIPVFLPGESLWTEEPGGLQFKGSQSIETTEETQYALISRKSTVLVLLYTQKPSYDASLMPTLMGLPIPKPTVSVDQCGSSYLALQGGSGER